MRQSRPDDKIPVIYKMPNNLKDKVTLGGRIKDNGIDAELLARADAHVAAMADTLLEDLDHDLERLENTCRQAEDDADMRETHLFELEKVAHEIKGYGSNVGFDLLTQIGNSLSVILRNAELPATTRMKIARAHVDSISLVFRRQIKGDGGEAGKMLTSALNLAVSKFLPAK